MNSPWPAKQTELLRELIAQRLTSSQIAAAMTEAMNIKFTRSMVIGKAQRLKLKIGNGSRGGRPVGSGTRHPSTLSDAMQSELRRLYRSGMTDRAIEALTGVSRFKVARWRGINDYRPVNYATKAPLEPSPRMVMCAVPPRNLEARFADGYEGQHGRLSILDLREGVCRFPVAMPDGATKYCGLPTSPGSAWCPDHRARCCVSRYGEREA